MMGKKTGMELPSLRADAIIHRPGGTDRVWVWTRGGAESTQEVRRKGSISFFKKKETKNVFFYRTADSGRLERLQHDWKIVGVLLAAPALLYAEHLDRPQAARLDWAIPVRLKML
jgi:hypothetical protein